MSNIKFRQLDRFQQMIFCFNLKIVDANDKEINIS